VNVLLNVGITFLCQTIEHVIEDMKFALAHLLFTIACRHTWWSILMIFFNMMVFSLSTSRRSLRHTSWTTLCWLDVPGDRITQRHRRLVKTEHKTSKVLATNRDDCASRRVAELRRAALHRNKTTDSWMLSSLFSLFARYVKFTTRIRGSTISSSMTAFVAFYRVFDLRIFFRSNTIYLCVSGLHTW